MTAKLISLFKAAPEVSPEQFKTYWREILLPDLKKFGIVRAVHHHVIPSDIREGEGLPVNRWAGVGCYYFDTEAEVRALLANPDFTEMLRKHAAFLPEVTHLPVNEVWIYNRDPSHLPLKMFAFFKRKPQFTREYAHNYYRTTHADVGESINRNRTVRYIQNHVLLDYTNPQAEYDYDAGPEIWFKSMEIALDLFGDTEGMAILGADEEKFVLRSELLHFLTDEETVFERTPTPALEG